MVGGMCKYVNRYVGRWLGRLIAYKLIDDAGVSRKIDVSTRAESVLKHPFHFTTITHRCLLTASQGLLFFGTFSIERANFYFGRFWG
jgi:hypothetical protein